MMKTFGAMFVLFGLLNIAAIAGLIYFVFWCLRHFGVIG